MIKLIPTPKVLNERAGSFSLSSSAIYFDADIDPRIKKSAAVLAREIGQKTGELCPLSCADASAHAIVITSKKGDDESYVTEITEDRITLYGNGDPGAFYAIQTLRQLVSVCGLDLPCLYIEDEPDFKMRGFYQDITRGRVNKLEKLKKIADMMSFYKVNMLQLYIEDAYLFKEFEGIVPEDAALTAEEVIEFDDYCHDRFIELIPSMSTFGHLFTLLQSERFNHICELEGHEMKSDYWMEKQWHHTVDVYNPQTIRVIGSMIEQYMALFRSDKFNICCDETMDLCAGKNKGKDKGEAFFHHLTKLIDILKSHGRTVMIWGDEVMARPEMMKQKVSDDVIVLNWCYRKHIPEWLPRCFPELGFTQVVCPGTSSWSCFVEDLDISIDNITEFTAAAKVHGALGVLNTNWGDFGHICSFNCNLYGALLGAQKSWNTDAVCDNDFEIAATKLLYKTDEVNMVEVIMALAKAERTAEWGRFVCWRSKNVLEGEKTDLKYGGDEDDVSEKDAIEHIAVCEREQARLSALKVCDRTAIGDVILAARAITLMNRLYLYANGVDGYTDATALQADFNSWLGEYREAWLRDDKPSQLWRLSEFIEHITEIPVRGK